MPGKLLASVALTVLFAATAATAKELEDRKWIEVSTPEFRVYSALTEKQTVNLVRRLDLLRTVVPIVTSLGRRDSDIPTEIIAVRNAKDFEIFGGGRGYAGVFRSGIRNNTILFRGVPSMDETSIILHEYAHFLLGNNGAFDYPRWFNEGYADYLSASDIAGEQFQVGIMLEHRMRNLGDWPWLPAEKILDSSRYEDFRGSDVAMFYAQSWALVHFLMNQDVADFDFRESMKRYLELRAGGTTEIAAFEQSMGLSADDLASELRKYLGRSRYTYINFDVNALQPEFEPDVRRMSRSEVSLALGRTAATFGRTDDARRWFGIALEDPATTAGAEAGLASLLLEEGDTEAARERFEKAASLAPDDAGIRADLANFWLQRALQGNFPSERESWAKKARQEFVAAWQLNDSMPEVFLGYGQTFLIEGDRIDTAIEMFESAYVLHPSSVDIMALLTETYAAAGRDADAIRIAKSILAMGHDGNRAATLARSVLSRFAAGDTQSTSEP